MDHLIPEISVVSPVYAAEESIDELIKRVITEVEKITSNFEIILVEDGSPDKSWTKIATNCNADNRVKGIKLSRNFGQHYAITAGLEASTGQHVVVMDCDLQDNPSYIPLLYAEAVKGYDIVYTSKKFRRHGFLKNLFARIFFLVFNYLSENQSARADVGSFSMLSRAVVNAFSKIKDAHRHYLMVLRSLGYTSSYVTVVHERRFAGKSSYSFSKLFKHAVNGITSQSDKLLRISIAWGLSFFVIAICWTAFLIIQYFMRGSQPGYTSIMVLVLLSTGLILMSIGITGIYIGKIFEQVKERPLYFIEKKVNL